MTRTLIAAVAAVALSGCKPPLHLQYDFGRAYIETLRLQADLTRPSVANTSYHLYGIEGVMIRINVQADSSDQEDAGFEVRSQN